LTIPQISNPMATNQAAMAIALKVIAFDLLSSVGFQVSLFFPEG